MRVSTLALIVLAQFSRAFAADSQNSIDAVLQSKLAETAEEHRLESGASGLIIAIATRDGRVAQVAVGSRSSNSNVKATATDRVMIGSISKSLTAALALRVVEKGLINWDTKVGSVFENLKGARAGACAEASLEQLLCHRSGLDLPFAPKVAQGQQSGETFRRSLLASAFAMAPVGLPGQKYRYSSSGSFVASLLEAKLGKPYEILMEQELFAPLGLRSFSLERPWKMFPSASMVSEVLIDGRLKEAPVDWQPHLKYDASGGWSCSLPELVQLGLSMTYDRTPRHFSNAGLARLFSSPYRDGICLGWSGGDRDPWRMHAGSTALGDTSVLAIAPKLGVCFAFFLNRNTGDPGVKEVRDRLTNTLRSLLSGR